MPLVDCAHPVHVGNTVPSSSAALCEHALPNHDSALLTGRLTNSEILVVQLVKLTGRHPSLFGDVLSCTHMIEHNIDVGDAVPIKQRFY